MNPNGNNGNPMETREGNTKTSRVVPGLYWCFTLNNYTIEEMETLETSFKEKEIRYIFGEEVGEKCGTPHLQGFISCKTKIRPSEKFGNKRIHWEKCKGNEEQNIKYCSKGDVIHTNIKIKRKPKVLNPEELYPWQLELLNILKNEPDDRTIHWYWSKEGMTGKTTFCKFLSATMEAIPLEGKKNDILYCAAEFESDIYLWDLERSMEDYVSYGALEKIKNGYYMCSKYESKPIIRACPHVVVFANFTPNLESLSQDRWNIVNVDTNTQA